MKHISQDYWILAIPQRWMCFAQTGGIQCPKDVCVCTCVVQWCVWCIGGPNLSGRYHQERPLVGAPLSNALSEGVDAGALFGGMPRQRPLRSYPPVHGGGENGVCAVELLGATLAK